MDIYALDENLERSKPIDEFEDVIWTERYSSSGDFKLTVSATDDLVEALTEGSFVSTPNSVEVMQVESQNIKNGKLIVSGPSMTDFFKNRIVRNPSGTAESEYWAIRGTPQGLMSTIVRDMCKAGMPMDTGTVLPNGYGSLEVFDDLTIAPYLSVGTEYDYAVEFGSVYDALKKLADTYELGFRLGPRYSESGGYVDLYFEAYFGVDRTSTQTVNEIVTLDSAMDTLANVEEFRSIAGYRNVAYVFSPTLSANFTAPELVGMAFSPEADPTGASPVTRFKRRTMMVTATDLTTDEFEGSRVKAQDALNQRAKDVLANNNYVRMLNGELVPQTGYQFGIDYFLGDIIELKSPRGGFKQRARVTEHIRSQNASGEKSYPTLSVISE